VGSAVPVPVPGELTLLLAESVQTYGGEWMVPRIVGYPSVDPRAIQKTVRAVRGSVDGLPGSFSFHDLRHYLASLLIASGADIKTVQARLRHASATTTLNTYGHLWPDADESTRAAIAAVINKRIRTAPDQLRTERQLGAVNTQVTELAREPCRVRHLPGPRSPRWAP
jgi:integrase